MTLLTAKTTEPIPGYRVVQRIGAGGYGEVWTAEAPGELKKAIKFVYGLLDEDRAARELKALNRIKGVRHPFLLSLERIEVIEGQLVIVTELADCSLKDRFEECRKQNLPGIPRNELLACLKDAADALDYMSEQHSLQHLDVKPENLLILSGRVKVADFGLVKDIHDHTASMMGGLTPVYAPPEVFEGRPSRRSDQYSLAIVFQEMLTGVLPFPGRTAAQLAAQHLNAKPRLGALSAGDQEVIARALSKKPTERFTHCRELIDALEIAGKQPFAGQAAAGAPATPPPASPGAMATQGATSVRAAVGQAATSALGMRTAAHMLQNLEDASQAVEDAVNPSDSVRTTGSDYQPPTLAGLGPAPPVVDQPPVEVDPAVWQPRPTLFIGLGGLGTRVLGRLRRRLNDRVDASVQSLFPMLVLDSDARDLSVARQATGDLLRPDELHSLPLRRSQDYRNESRNILHWLSRRWLYNIPRSQQTEGLRPLGRLSLVDHAELALGRLRAAVQGLKKSAASFPQGSAAARPRIVIIGAIGGGTGGGMLTDICFAARQILDEQELNESEVLAVLAHGTNRNPQQQELAAVNALATLTELEQFHRSPFPGDVSCGLKERATTEGALQAAYLVHLGEELSQEQYDSACDRLSQFLLLDSVSPVAAALDQCRLDLPEGGSALPLRTFGLVQIGFAHDDIVQQAVTRACRGVIERWIGEPRREEVRKNVRLLRGKDDAPLPLPPVSPQAAIEAKAVAIVDQLKLDLDPLMQMVQQLAVDEMRGNVESFFLTLAPYDVSQPLGNTQIQQWYAASAEVFGTYPDEGAQPQAGRLLMAIESRIARLIQQIGKSLRQAIECIVDDPVLRVHGGQKVAKLLQGHLKGLSERFRDARGRLHRESQAVRHQIWAALSEPKGKGKKGPRHTPEQIQALFLQDCRLRLFDLCAQVSGSIGHALQSHASGAYDILCDLARDLHHLAVQLARDESHEEEEEVDQGDDLMAPLRTLVGHELRNSDDRLAADLDQQLTGTAIAAAGGLKAAILAGGQQRDALVDELRVSARQAVLRRLAAIDIAGEALGDDRGPGQHRPSEGQDHPLGQLIARAQPWFQPCGGQRRLILVVPAAAAPALTPEALATRLGSGEYKQLPSVVPDASQDVVLLFEMGGLSLRHAAAAVIGMRCDLADLATRLHTRSDITWTPLLG